MVKTLLFILLIIFAIGGLCEFIYAVKMLFCYPNLRIQNYSLIVLKKQSAVSQLDFLWQKIKWQGDSFAVGIIAIVDEIDTAELAACQKYINNKNIILCNALTVKNTALQGELINGNR